MTMPLSRMTSITSARPLGLGRSRYPPPVRGCVATAAISSPLARLLGRQGLLGLAEELAADVRPVLGKRLGDPRLADPVQVADRPVELLQRVLGRAAVAVGLVAGRGAPVR